MKGIIMAAGKGQRLNMNQNKAFLTLYDKPMIDYAYEALKEVTSDIIIIASNENYKDLKDRYMNSLVLIQKEERGTAGALFTALDILDDLVIVIPCDMPLITHQDLKLLISEYKNEDVLFLAGINNSKNDFGKILENPLRIKESPCVSDIVNVGVYLFRVEFIKENRNRLNIHEDEYYITDFIELGNSRYILLDGDILGVNSLYDASKVYQKIKENVLRHHLENGVNIIDVNNTFIDTLSIISPNTTIESGTIIDSIIGEGNIIRNSYIKNTNIGFNNNIIDSYITDSIILNDNSIGPFSRIRENTLISSNNRIGNFVEIKNSYIKNNNKMSHHAYIGDSIIGNDNNIGCGVITCNYNGQRKNKIIMKDNNFIGSNSNLIAPLSLGSFNYIASGSTLDKNLNNYDFYISRKRGSKRSGYAKKYFNKKS